MARAAPPPPPRYFALDVLVAVEEAAREARERGERADRHDETKKGALADHDACPFERGSAHEVRRGGDCSPSSRSSARACRPPEGGLEGAERVQKGQFSGGLKAFACVRRGRSAAAPSRPR